MRRLEGLSLRPSGIGDQGAGPQLSSGAKASGQGDWPGLIARRDLPRLSRSAALMTQGYTGPCAPWSDGTYN